MSMEFEEYKVSRQPVILTYSSDVIESLKSKCNEINNNMMHFLNYLNNDVNTNTIIGDYAKRMTDNIYLIFDVFKEMRICPDQFYNIIFKANDKYYTLISQGMRNKDESLYIDSTSSGEISDEIQEGLEAYRKTSHKFNPTISQKISKEVEEGLRIYLKPTAEASKTVSEYYVQMINFMKIHNLPCGVVDDVNMCINAFDDFISSVDLSEIKDSFGVNITPKYIDVLCRLLFGCFQFMAAIGVNPEDVKKEEYKIDNSDEKRVK